MIEGIFRVFDKIKKEITYNCVALAWSENSVHVEVEYKPNRFTNMSFSSSCFEFSSYTGQKDKNGKDIYFGDFLKGWTKYSFNRFNNCEVRFKKEIIMCGNIPLCNCKELEVVGNIYKNQDLLNV